MKATLRTSKRTTSETLRAVERPGKFRCPFTGKWVDRPPPRETQADQIARLTASLADMRRRWALFQPSDRTTGEALKLIRQYKKEAHTLWQVTGERAPPIYLLQPGDVTR